MGMSQPFLTPGGLPSSSSASGTCWGYRAIPCSNLPKALPAQSLKVDCVLRCLTVGRLQIVVGQPKTTPTLLILQPWKQLDQSGQFLSPGSDLGALAYSQIDWRLGPIDRWRGAGEHPTNLPSEYLAGAARWECSLGPDRARTGS